LGGSDQWGNITMGTELIRKVTGTQAAGLTSPLLLRSDGKKFGKSEGGNERVWLDAALTPPFALHQHLLNSDDASTPQMLRFFTFLDHETILELDEALVSAPQERRAQRALANAVVTLVHGDAAALSAGTPARRSLARPLPASMKRRCSRWSPTHPRHPSLAKNCARVLTSRNC